LLCKLEVSVGVHFGDLRELQLSYTDSFYNEYFVFVWLICLVCALHSVISMQRQVSLYGQLTQKCLFFTDCHFVIVHLVVVM